MISSPIKEVKIEPLEKRESKPSERAVRDLQGKLFSEENPLPSIALLDPADDDQQVGYSKARLEELSILLEQKLADFGIKAEVMAVAPGPVITRFEIQPAPGTKASKVSGIAQDLARSMACDCRQYYRLKISINQNHRSPLLWVMILRAIRL